MHCYTGFDILNVTSYLILRIMERIHEKYNLGVFRKVMYGDFCPENQIKPGL